MVRLDEIRPGVWDATVEVMEEALRDLEFDGDDIVVRVDKHEYLLPLSSIDRARVEPTPEWIERARSATVSVVNDSLKEGDLVLDDESET